MEFKKLANNALNFAIYRVIEIAGIFLVISGFMLLVSLVSFSPDDPNFIFPENSVIKNFFGFRGSFTADFFFSMFWFCFLINSF